MKKVLLSVVLVLALISGCRTGGDNITDSKWVIWYQQPADGWTEALPVGNGSLGAMVFGDVAEERLQLNEDTMWAGSPMDRDKEGNWKYLDKARELSFAGKYLEAERMMHEKFQSERWIRSYQTLGDMRIAFPGHEEGTESYRRELDLDQAVARVSYRKGETVFSREVFSSAPHGVLVVRLESSSPGGLDCNVSLDRPQQFATRVEDETLVMSGQVRQGEDPDEPDIEQSPRVGIGLDNESRRDFSGVHYQARLQPFLEGAEGELDVVENHLEIRGADALTLILAAGTFTPAATRSPSPITTPCSSPTTPMS